MQFLEKKEYLEGKSEQICDLVVFDCLIHISEMMGILDRNQGSS